MCAQLGCAKPSAMQSGRIQSPSPPPAPRSARPEERTARRRGDTLRIVHFLGETEMANVVSLPLLCEQSVAKAVKVEAESAHVFIVVAVLPFAGKHRMLIHELVILHQAT